MKIKLWQLEYDFDTEDAKIVVPLILLLLGLIFTQLRKDALLGARGRLLYPVLFSPAVPSGTKRAICTGEPLVGFQVPILQEPRSHFAGLSGLQVR
jgi:hypothetical protein